MDAGELMHRLHGEDVYAGLDAAAEPDDLQGWNSTDPHFGAVIRRVRPSLVVEVGSWKGASAVHMLDEARAEGLRPTLLCVDTWLGALEHRAFDATGVTSLRPTHGYPRLYYTFLANILRRGLGGQVVPFPNTSLTGAAWLASQNIRPDLVFLDGSHAFLEVFLEMSAFYDRLRPGGVLFGDDFDWAEVRAAVTAFCRLNGLCLEDHGVQWAVERRDARPSLPVESLFRAMGRDRPVAAPAAARPSAAPNGA